MVDYVVAVLRDKQFASLTELNANNLNLSLTPIAQALAKNRTLRKISMLNNNFTADELLQLLNVLLESNFTLTKLQLLDETALASESTAIEKIFTMAATNNEVSTQRQKQKQVLQLQSVLQRFNEEIQEVRVFNLFFLKHAAIISFRPFALPSRAFRFRRLSNIFSS